jgi:hypothetical protein
MPAITGDNALRLRYPYQRVKPDSIRLNIFRKEIKATASINQASFTYPLAELTVDNTSADWSEVREGELFEVVDGSGNVVYTDNHRRNPNSTTVYLSRIRGGTDQRARFTAELLADNYTINSYTVQTPASFVSRVDETVSATVIYKRVDIELNATYPQTQYPKPQPNFGAWRQADADSNGDASFEIDASGSLSFLGGTLSYLHEPPANMTITSGVDTDAAVTIEATEPGQYVYGIRVQDDAIPSGSSQRQKRGFRYYFVNGTGYPALNQQYTVLILTDEEFADGRTILFRAYGSGAYGELYTNAPLLLTYDLEFSEDGETWEQLDDGLSRRSFVGYITDFSTIHTDSRGVQYVDFTAQSPLLLYNRLPIVEQFLEEAATVENWQQTVAALMHAVFAAYYGIEFHAPHALYMHDLRYSTGADGFFSNPFPIKAGSIADAVKALGERMGFGLFTCTSDGLLGMMRNPNVEDTTYRDAVASVWTWNEDDVADDGNGIEYVLNESLAVKETTGSFIWYDSGDNSVAQGRSNLYAPSQATGSQLLPDHIALGLSDGLARIGHMHQRANRKVLSIFFTTSSMVGELVSCADLEWHTMDYAEYDYADVGVFAMRHLPAQVSRVWGNDLTLRQSITFEPETYGEPADEIIYLEPGTMPPDAFLWLSIGETPAGWSAYGTLSSTSGWQGTTTDLAGTYTATRAAGEGWTNTSGRFGIKKVYPTPVDITRIVCQWNGDPGASGSRRIAVAVKFASGTIKVLANDVRTDNTPPWEQVIDHSENLFDVIEIYFFAMNSSIPANDPQLNIFFTYIYRVPG